MTLFMLDLFKKKGVNVDVWDGLRPPSACIRSVYYDLKWSNKLFKIDNLPFSTRISFLILKAIQIISYCKGWKAGGKM